METGPDRCPVESRHHLLSLLLSLLHLLVDRLGLDVEEVLGVVHGEPPSAGGSPPPPRCAGPDTPPEPDEPKAGAEAGEGALSSAFSSSPIPCWELSVRLLVESWFAIVFSLGSTIVLLPMFLDLILMFPPEAPRKVLENERLVQVQLELQPLQHEASFSQPVLQIAG